jgi:polar amino acid transport system substrate-binding protein
MLRTLPGLFLLLSVIGGRTAAQAPPAARSELAPSGTLRVGINYNNRVLATRDPAGGDSRGVAVDLAREIGRRLAVPVELVPYTAAGRMADGAKAGEWDIAFLADDPGRAADITFTVPYLEIDMTYLVPPGSAIRTIEEVDRAGVRIAAVAQSAYEMFLTRSLKQAQVVRVAANQAADAALASGAVEVLSGLRDRLLTVAEGLPGSRVLDGRFTVARQAIGMPKGRDTAAAYLNAFVEEAKASGLVARAIGESGARGVSVAPPRGKP